MNKSNDVTYFEKFSEPVGSRLLAGLSKVGVALKSQAWKKAGPLRLTPTQAQVLVLLHRSPGPLRLSRVAQGLAVTAATVSDTVETLSKKGLIHKTEAPDDNRALALTLTAEGKAEAERLSQWPDVLLEAVSSLEGVEQEVFLRGLIKMIKTLQERGQIPVSSMCVTCRYFRPNAHEGSDKPHHCALVDAPFADQHLRLDCPDHVPAPGPDAVELWQKFTGTSGVPGKEETP